MGIPQRALLTLPFGLVIGRSSIPDAGIGVLNNGPVVSPGMHFGPYEGEVTAKENALTSHFSWEVSLEMFQFYHQYMNYDLPDVYTFSRCYEYASIPADLQRGGHVRVHRRCKRITLKLDEVLFSVFFFSVRHVQAFQQFLNMTPLVFT